MLRAFVAFREEVVSRRTRYLLRKARDRAHVLVGLAIAVANIDEVIALIRTRARSADGARAADGAPLAGQGRRAADPLIDDPRHRINEDLTYNLSEEQARAILELRLPA
jgi:DNA gyrase subunit A